MYTGCRGRESCLIWQAHLNFCNHYANSLDCNHAPSERSAELPKDFSPPKRYLHLNYVTKLFSMVNGRGRTEEWT